MFGYVKVCKPELLIKEYEQYKAVYCTLCKRIGRRYGVIARLSLSYDFTFLALLQMSVTGDCGGYKQGRCVYNPLKKCAYCCGAQAQFDLTAAAEVIAVYYKMCDSVDDESGVKRLFYRIIRAIFARQHRKAAEAYPDIEQIFKRFYERQTEVQFSRNSSIDAACEPTADAMAELFESVGIGDSNRRILYRLGYCVGKWIYLADAFDDIDNDRRTGNFNPLIDTDRDEVQALMNTCSCEAGLAMELLPHEGYYGIMKNILFFGLPEQARIIKEKSERK